MFYYIVDFNINVSADDSLDAIVENTEADI